MNEPIRILVTGSRNWTDKTAIGQAICWAIGEYGEHLIVPDGTGHNIGPVLFWDRITIVHGAARGADTHADRIARAWGMNTEAHSADWTRHGRAAGPIRTTAMVNLHHQHPYAVCLGFPLGRSVGTRHAMAQARAAGIPTIDWAADGPGLITSARGTTRTA